MPIIFGLNLSFLLLLFFSPHPFVDDPAPWFPRLCQSTTAYISVPRLSRSRIHTPANHRSTPSIRPIHLSVKQLCSLPLSPSFFQNSPLPQKRQDPPLTIAATQAQGVPAFQNTRLCRDVIQMHTHINAHAKTNGRAETAALQLVHGGIHCLFASFCHAI